MSQGYAAKTPITEIITKLEEIDSYQLAVECLSARGLVRPRTSRSFWLFREEHTVVNDLDVVRGIRERVCDVLFKEEFPSPRDVCLISLLDATRKFRRVVDPERVQQAVEQTKRYVNLDLVGRRQESQHRADVDDPTAALRTQMRQHLTGQPHQPEEIGVEDLLRLGYRTLLRGADDPDTGIVDQNVDATRALDHR